MSWPMVKLDKVITFIRGVTFKPDDQVSPFSQDSVVVMRTKNVQMKGLDTSDLIAIPKSLVKRQEQMLIEGDILMSSANSWELVGKSSYVENLGYISTAGGFISIVRAKKDMIYPRYLFHWIMDPKNQHNIRYCGRKTTNISNLDVSRFKELQIPLPPLEEQKRIAAILDKADVIRQKRKQAIELADEFLRSVFLDMFGDPVSNPKGWEVKSLSALIMKGDKINYGIVQPGDHVEDGIPIVRVGDIKDGSIDKSKLKRVARIIDEKHSKSRLVGDEILITCVGATVGKVALADASLSGFNTVRALTRVRLNEEVNRSFVFRYLQSPFIQGYFQSQLRTVGQPTLNGKQIGETPILLPNLNMQREFLQLSDRALTIKDLSNSQLIEADNMSNSLSQKAFSGQL
ncbi:restriction endonuclease subunit S [Aliivibrio fischeri]|uniref:restriction endonuclease subunit S n=1 Tax=Aliivibrio fischeri TaxID=668 RepID=UPI0012DA2680|nr:restriction endonuclease subunit S [Aliivibrio fischeri]MUK68988.1 restriction endonuclease subunit S [Aliivibrio fischeri]MUK71977.1 restriction endonuclease subunit S [Aliivibrio fischeri]